LKLYIAKICKELLTRYVGAAVVIWDIVVEPVLAFVGSFLTSKVLPLSVPRKSKSGNSVKKVPSGFTLGLRPTYVKFAVPGRTKCPRNAPGMPPASVKMSAE